VRAVGAVIGPEPHGAFVVEVEPVERELVRQTLSDRRGEFDATQRRRPRSDQP
jgi:hypothetical protein